MAIERRPPFVDDDLDAHVSARHVDDPGGARMRFEETLTAAVALDTSEVPLQRRRVEDFVVVDDAPQEPEELR